MATRRFPFLGSVERVGWLKAIAEKLVFELLSRVAPKRADHRIVVLCYHRIVPRGDADNDKAVELDRFTVHREDFSNHISAILEAGFEVIGPDQIAGFTGRGVVITFDDNISTHVAHALPVLQEHGVSATFFLNPDCLNVDNEMWDQDVRTLVDAGMTIGAHNATHTIAASMDLDDFSIAVDTCSEFLGRYDMQKLWAYPGGYLGSFTEEQDDLLRQRGFVRFTTLEGNGASNNLNGPQSRYVLRVNSSLKYVQAILDGRLAILAKFKQARFAVEKFLPGLARTL